VAHEEYRKRRRKQTSDVVSEIVAMEPPPEPVEADERVNAATEPLDPSLEPEGRAQAEGYGIWRWLGFLTLGAAFLLGFLSVFGVLSPDHSLNVFFDRFGLSSGSLALLGVILVVGSSIMRREVSIDAEVGYGIMRGLDEVSQRTQAVIQGVEGFRDRLEAIRADRVAATLNQVRFEVSTLHEKVHRELIPAADLKERLEGIAKHLTEFEKLQKDAKHVATLEALRSSVTGALDSLGATLASVAEGVRNEASANADLKERLDRLEKGVTHVRNAQENSSDAKALREFRASVEGTLNDLRVNLESIQGRIERESVSASELKERFDRLEEHIADFREGHRSPNDPEDLRGFCNSMEEALRKLNPDLESIRAAVESGASTAGRGLENVVGLVGRLEREIRDLDEKANRILRVSSDMQGGIEGLEEAESAAPVPDTTEPEPHRTAAREEEVSHPGGSHPHTSAPSAPSPTEAPERRDSTFRSAVERLRHLRG